MLASQIPHFDGVFMHSCLMGNMESLADLYPISDYTISCMPPSIAMVGRWSAW